MLCVTYFIPGAQLAGLLKVIAMCAVLVAGVVLTALITPVVVSVTCACIPIAIIAAKTVVTIVAIAAAMRFVLFR